MPIQDLNIRCRIEELPMLGGFLIGTLQSNLSAVSGVYPAFDSAFITKANTVWVLLRLL